MTPPSPALLGGLSAEEFLARYWQKQPLLIRGAIPGYRCPLSPEELAGLACDDDVTSRLILEHGGERPWQVRHGPFTEADFVSLDEHGWSLMVQEVDHLVPAVAELLSNFRFVPNWRIDDVMVSYAPPGGSVGAHVDNYDVFLFQGRGCRRWQIQRTPVVEERLVPGVDVRTIADFEPDETWLLEAGDMLYLPPRIAHHGVAGEDCMTFSIGFAAPDAGDLFAEFVASALEAEPADEGGRTHAAVNRRYADPDLQAQREPGEIAESARRRLHEMLQDVIADEHGFDRWLGRYLTTPRRIAPRPPDEPAEDLRQALATGAELLRSAVPHFAHMSIAGVTYLYAGGSELSCEGESRTLAALLSGRSPLTLDTLKPHLEDPVARRLIERLVREGLLEIHTGRPLSNGPSTPQ